MNQYIHTYLQKNKENMMLSQSSLVNTQQAVLTACVCIKSSRNLHQNRRHKGAPSTTHTGE